MKAIDGEELMDRVDFILSRLKSADLVSVFQTLKSYLENAPTLTLDDLRPKGRWEDGTCTNCGQVDFSKPNFCPNCGADMRGYTSDGQRNQEG